MKTFLILFATTFLVCSCKDKEPQKDTRIRALEKNYEAFEKADYHGWSGEVYYELVDFDAERLCDTLKSVNNLLIEDTAVRKRLNAGLSSWIRGTLFVDFRNANGSLQVDSVNSDTRGLDYYMNEKITPRKDLAGKLFTLRGSPTVGNAEGLYYDVVLCNLREIEENGAYRFVTKGSFRPLTYFHQKKQENGTTDTRMRSRTYEADLFVTIASDKQLEQDVAIRLRKTIVMYRHD